MDQGYKKQDKLDAPATKQDSQIIGIKAKNQIC